MTTTNLQNLVKRAISLADPYLCIEGHEWAVIGGRQCPKDLEECSQNVYQCIRCECVDYGHPEGPAHNECKNYCKKV